MKKLAFYGVGAIAVLALGSTVGWIPLVLVVGGAAAAYYWVTSNIRKAGGLGPWLTLKMGPKVGRRLLRWLRYVAQAGLMLPEKTWARVVALLIALWVAGDLLVVTGDPVLVPLLSLPLVGVFCWFYGRREIRQWDGWKANTEKTLAAILPRYRQTEEERRPTRYGVTPIGKKLGLFEGEYQFEVEVPKNVRQAQVFDIQEHLRERLRASQEVSWGFRVDLQQDLLHARAIPNIPTSILMSEFSHRDLDAFERDGVGFVSSLYERHASKDPTTFVPIGLALEGPISWDLSNLFGCILIAGAPGGGKSCAIKTIFHHTLLFRDIWEVYGVDMKRVELGPLRRDPHVKEVATTLADAARVLSNLRVEVERRYEQMERLGFNNIRDFNKYMEEGGLAGEAWKRVMAFIDEIAELVAAEGDEDDALRQQCKADINSLVRLGRAAGVHLVLATQRPDAEFIPGATKSNIGARLAMGSLSQNGAQMTLEATPEFSGISGRGWWFRTGQPLEQVQVYYTGDGDLRRAAAESPPQNGRMAA